MTDAEPMGDADPQLISVNAFTDDRGRVYFANDFDLRKCRRMYIVENFADRHRASLARASARTQVGDGADRRGPGVLRRDRRLGQPRQPTRRCIASPWTRPTHRCLSIPAGYANGAMALLPDTKLLYFSDASLEESMKDDFRYAARLLGSVARRGAMSVETSVVIPTLDDAADAVLRLSNASTACSPRSARPPRCSSSTPAAATAPWRRPQSSLTVYPLLHIRVLVQDRARSGFGSLVRLGVAYSQGRFCVIVMPDARDPLELIPKMITELRRGAHLVLCSRYEEAVADANVPWRFRAYQTAYRRGVKLLLRVDIPDSTYGFRAFNRTFVQALGSSGRRMSVCSEITFKVLLAGGVTTRVAGAQAGPMLREQSKFRLGNELGGYALTLAARSPASAR